jgi:ribosomal protein S18 acetylase RimI-like enzyme
MVTNNVEVVKLNPSDWPVYKELRLRALQEEPQAFGASYAENLSRPDSYWMERLSEVANGKNWLLFAKEGGNLIGMMGGFRKKEEPEDTVNIIAVYVVGEARGKGVSKKLMQTMLQEFENDPTIGRVKLSVNKDQAAAVGLYESFGFKVTGEENVKMGDGKFHDELNMEKMIARQHLS